MFGYVTPLKEELKVRQLDAFKSYYCGLCQHIKLQFGELPRMVLNYDLTTLALLLDGLSPNATYMHNKTCLVHPMKKKPMIVQNQALSYAACMNVSLAYYKYEDDLQDEPNIKSQTLTTLLKPYTSKFPEEILPVNHMITTHLRELYDLERNKNFYSMDEISHPFAQIVGNILKMYPYPLKEDSPMLREDLYQFGYALGKWIYIIDALDDLEKDMEHFNFNPILHLYQTTESSYKELLDKVQDTIGFSLLNCGYNCKLYLDKLPLVRNTSILKNIIVLGMMDQYTKVSHACSCKNRKGS